EERARGGLQTVFVFAHLGDSEPDTVREGFLEAAIVSRRHRQKIDRRRAAIAHAHLSLGLAESAPLRKRVPDSRLADDPIEAPQVAIEVRKVGDANVGAARPLYA